MRVKLTGPSRSDLTRITSWIAESNPERALSFVDELVDACNGIPNFPESHQVVGRFKGYEARRKTYGNYLIFYRIKGQTIEILRILHGAQDYSDLF
jgi:toxin ParE1/3/4